MNEELRTFLLPQISNEHTGFVPVKRSVEQILDGCQIIKKASEFNLKVIICFVDYKEDVDK